MTIEMAVREGTQKRNLVMSLEAGETLACANARRPVPQEARFPETSVVHAIEVFAIEVAEAGMHSFDELERFSTPLEVAGVHDAIAG